jgi:hypothetical protein
MATTGAIHQPETAHPFTVFAQVISRAEIEPLRRSSFRVVTGAEHHGGKFESYNFGVK